MEIAYTAEVEIELPLEAVWEKLNDRAGLPGANPGLLPEFQGLGGAGYQRPRRFLSRYSFQ